MLLHFDNIRVQVLDVFNVREDESLFWIKTKSNDILNIVNTHCDCALRSFKLEFWPIYVLFIVGDLNNQRHIKCVLQILGEDKWNSVSQMKCLSAWTTTCVQIKWLFLFISSENFVQVPLAEEDASSNEAMDGNARQILNTLNLFRSNGEAPVFVYQLVIVNTLIACGLYFERSYNILGCD